MKHNEDVKIFQLAPLNELHREYLLKFVPEYMINRGDIVTFAAIHKDYGIVGALVASAQNISVEIDYMIVSEEFRRQGIGTMLVNALLELVNQADTQYVVTYFFPYTLAHGELLEFTRSLSVFELIKHENGYNVMSGMISNNEKLSKFVAKQFNVKPVSVEEFSKGKYYTAKVTDFVSGLNKKDIDSADDLLRLSNGEISTKTSFVCETDNRITAVLLTSFIIPNKIVISYLYSETNDTNQIAALIKSLYNVVVGKDVNLLFTTESKMSQELARLLFGEPNDCTAQAIWTGLFASDVEEFLAACNG